MRLTADLSTPGTYFGTYKQICIPPASIWIYVEPTEEQTQGSVDASLLSGLVGMITIKDQSGSVVVEERLGEGIGFRMSNAAFPVGTYSVKLTVEKAAPGLGSLPHELVARYDISLLPIMSMLLSMLVILALAAGLAVIWLWIRLGRAARARLHRSWDASGRCSKCGYDLTGNVSGVCPECGTSTGDAHDDKSDG